MSAYAGIHVDRSRCLRHRYNKSACARCMDACVTGAVSFSPEGLSIGGNECTACMRCVAVCPTEALCVEGFTLQQAISDLRRADKPVLGCWRDRGACSHAGGPCLGFLSREHLVALPVLLGRPIQLNMTQCAGCGNAHVIDEIASSIHEIEGITAACTSGELDYEDIRTSRREFFRMLRGGSVRAVQGFATASQECGSNGSFSKKALPYKRQLLNHAYTQASGTVRERLKGCYVQVRIGTSCNGCMACVAMCPTGALSKGDRALGFDTFSCSGCMLCEEFCKAGAISIDKPLPMLCLEER